MMYGDMLSVATSCTDFLFRGEENELTPMNRLRDMRGMGKEGVWGMNGRETTDWDAVLVSERMTRPQAATAPTVTTT